MQLRVHTNYYWKKNLVITNSDLKYKNYRKNTKSKKLNQN